MMCCGMHITKLKIIKAGTSPISEVYFDMEHIFRYFYQNFYIYINVHPVPLKKITKQNEKKYRVVLFGISLYHCLRGA